jgi:hypothetical protein
MAQIHKAGARKPRIEDGFVYTKCDYATVGPERPCGVMPPFEYKLAVSAKGASLGGEYTAQLTEAEMLRTIAEWMAMYVRNRTRELEPGHAGKR